MPGFALDPVTSDRLQRLWHFPYLGVFLGLFLWPLGKIMNKVFGKDQKVLINQGKTDSRISVHQVLYKTPGIQLALVGILNTKRFYPSIRSDKTLKRVFDDLQQGKLPKLKYDSEQHAAAEYMEKLLKGVSAEVSQPFCGTLVCSEGHCIEEMSQFSTLQLPFKKDMCSVATGVQELFECYNTCGDTKAAVTNKKKPPPLNLVFHLRRFDLKKKMGHVKSDCEVELTETIVTQGHVYSLYGVVDHWDSVREGRYTATISENGQWFQYGDNCRQVDAPNGTK